MQAEPVMYDPYGAKEKLVSFWALLHRSSKEEARLPSVLTVGGGYVGIVTGL